MKLNSIEKALMNNPVRAAIQKYYEAPLLRRLGGEVVGQYVLEIGCGRGVGTEILLNDFKCAHITAFDLDSEMVEKAKHRTERSNSKVSLFIGDATQIPAENESFDAVFDFGIIHHIPEWQNAVKEISRVLKPSGKFYFEEVTKKALDRLIYRTFLQHPRENRFGSEEFIQEVEKHHLQVQGNYTERFFGDFLFGVATKSLELSGIKGLHLEY